MGSSSALDVSFAHITGDVHLRFLLDNADASQFDIRQAFSAGKFYEHETSLIMIRVLRPGDVCLDVGANVGFFTVLMGSLVGPSGHVFAFEPNPRHKDALRHHIDHNGIAATVLPVAIGEAPSLRAFSDGGDHDGNGGFVPEHLADGHALVAVDTLDRLAGDHRLMDRLKLLKLDIEGAEGEALFGAQALLRSGSLEVIVCEGNPPLQAKLGRSFPALRELLRAHGFDCFLPSATGDLPTYVPHAVEIDFRAVANVVFFRPDVVSRYWPRVSCLPARFVFGY